MRFALLAITLIASLSFAHENEGGNGSMQCQTKCNVTAADCMKACSIDPKQTQRPELVNKMMNCIKSCQSRMEGCKGTCPK